MPEKTTKDRAREDARAGKSPSTQAGEFVREEIHHVREGKHGARSPEQAIAIGLSKARRAGVKLPPKKSARPKTRAQAERDLARGREAPARKPSAKRSRAVKGALAREGGESASRPQLARQGKEAARRRSPEERSAAAAKAARQRSPEERSASARKGAATRRRNVRRAARRA
jgi:hypothetical protein